LPALQTYFGLIHNTGNRDFDVSRTSALELEWWIVHRQREPDDPVERVRPHGNRTVVE